MTFAPHATASLLMLLLSTVAAAAVNEPEENALLPALSAQWGEQAYRVQLGMGYWNGAHSEHGQVYVSHFEAKDDLHVDSQNLGEHRYRSSRIGLEANGFAQGKAYQGGLFLYRNKSAANIDRYGVGFDLSLGKMLGQRTRVLVGAELMPEPLSSDWDAKALIEYSLKAGIDVLLHKNITLGVQYYYGATIDEKSADHYGKLLGGLSFKL